MQVVCDENVGEESVDISMVPHRNLLSIASFWLCSFIYSYLILSLYFFLLAARSKWFRYLSDIIVLSMLLLKECRMG